MSPRIMKVAVPLPKHSAMFGQEASSQTVCRRCSRRIRLISWKRESGIGARTRIQSGLASFAFGTNCSRAVFSAPFCLTPASRTVEPFAEQCGEPRACALDCVAESEGARLRHLQAGKAAGIDGLERREVHVHVERQAVEGAAARDADAQRRDLGAVYIDAGCPGPAFAAALEQVDDRLLEQRDKLLDLDAAARQIHQRVQHRLARSVI